MNNTSRRRTLETIGLVHPRPEAVTSPLFQAADPFFYALDKVQARETGRISLYPPSVALALLHVEPRQGRVDSHGCERVP